MKRLLIIAAPLIAGCTAELNVPHKQESGRRTQFPTVNPPLSYRQLNWSCGSPENGSCVHACWITLLRNQGRHAEADRWRQTYGGGDHADRFHQRLDQTYLFTDVGRFWSASFSLLA